jgi:hypothetical protein
MKSRVKVRSANQRGFPYIEANISRRKAPKAHDLCGIINVLPSPYVIVKNAINVLEPGRRVAIPHLVNAVQMSSKRALVSPSNRRLQ